MSIVRLPDIFKDSPWSLDHDGICVVNVSHKELVDKRRILVEKNMVFLLVHGQKTLHSNRGAHSIIPGEGFMVNAGNYLTTEKFKDLDGHYEALFIFFENHQLADWLRTNTCEADESEAGALSRRVNKVVGDEMLDIFTRNLRQLVRRPGDRVLPMLKVKLFELFHILATGDSRQGFIRFIANLRKTEEVQLQLLMEQHFKDDLSIDQFAFLANKSVSTFKRHFRKVFDMSPKNWVKSRRIEEARGLLANPDYDVQQVGFDSGFENAAHFVKSFKDQLGLTPGEYRNRLQAHRVN